MNLGDLDPDLCPDCGRHPTRCHCTDPDPDDRYPEQRLLDHLARLDCALPADVRAAVEVYAAERAAEALTETADTLRRFHPDDLDAWLRTEATIRRKATPHARP